MQRSGFVLPVVAAVVLLGAAAPASAGEAATGEVVVATRRVPLGAADFVTPASVERLYSRLASAARRVCASSVAPQTYSSACAERALDSAIADVGDGRLTAVHLQRRGG